MLAHTVSLFLHVVKLVFEIIFAIHSRKRDIAKKQIVRGMLNYFVQHYTSTVHTTEQKKRKHFYTRYQQTEKTVEKLT